MLEQVPQIVGRKNRSGTKKKQKALLPSAFCLLPSAFCLLPSAFCLLPSAFYVVAALRDGVSLQQ
jgi:hypothetical protein